MRHGVAAWTLAAALIGGVAAAQPSPDAQPTPPPDAPKPPDAPDTPTPAPDAPKPPEPPKPPETPRPPADLPPPGRANDPTGIAGYDHGLFVATRDDAFRLRVGAWLQARWQIGNDGGQVEQRFSIPVGRILVGGHAFGTSDFLVSGDLGQGTFELRDAYLDQPVPYARLQVGQFKPYFSQQQLAEPVNLEFTDHAITYAWAGITRDLGASLHHEPAFDASGVVWALGIFNGTGITPEQQCATTTDPITMQPVITCLPPTTVPANERPLTVARIGWTGARVDPDHEGDLGGDRPRFAVGLGYAGDLAHGDTRAMTHVITADAVVKAYGWSLTTAVFVRSARTTTRDTSLAWQAQVGYVFVPHLLELAGRFAQIPNGIAYEQEMLGVLDVYRRGHDLKFQIESGGTRLTDSRAFDWVVRAQTQLLF